MALTGTEQIFTGNPDSASSPAAAGKDYSAQVKSFRDNLPQYQNQLFQGAVNQGKTQLAGQMAGITNNVNSRGLLYGGIHQGANQEAQAGIAGQLAQQRLQTNHLTQGLADQFDNEQLNQAMERYKGDVDYNEKMYNLGLQQANAQAQQQAGLIGSIGGLIGLGAAII